MTVVKDLTGQLFGNLLVLEQMPRQFDEKGRKYPIMWHCKCLNCGGEIALYGQQLRGGRTSCGCIKKGGTAQLAVKHSKYADILKDSRKVEENNESERVWGPCPHRIATCYYSQKGWCCHDCKRENCLNRCLNTPGPDRLKHCGCKRLDDV